MMAFIPYNDTEAAARDLPGYGVPVTRPADPVTAAILQRHIAAQRARADRAEAENQQLRAACGAALLEFDRLTGERGFEPDRYAERLQVFYTLRAALDGGAAAEVE